MINEKAVATNNGFNKINEQSTVDNSTPTAEKTQRVFTFGSRPPITTITVFDGQNDVEPFCFAGMRLVCDECCLPLYLFGENFIESYTNGRANLLQCLCDTHAAERGWL
jgi:hypothetical protein